MSLPFLLADEVLFVDVTARGEVTGSTCRDLVPVVVPVPSAEPSTRTTAPRVGLPRVPWESVLRWTARAALVAMAGAAVVAVWAVARAVWCLVDGLSWQVTVCGLASLALVGWFAWYYAVGQFLRAVVAPVIRAADVRMPSGPARRAITGPRAVVPTRPVTVEVISVTPLGGGPR